MWTLGPNTGRGEARCAGHCPLGLWIRAPCSASLPFDHNKHRNWKGQVDPCSPVGLIPHGLVTWLIQPLLLAFQRQQPPQLHGSNRGFQLARPLMMPRVMDMELHGYGRQPFAASRWSETNCSPGWAEGSNGLGGVLLIQFSLCHSALAGFLTHSRDLLPPWPVRSCEGVRASPILPTMASQTDTRDM